MTSQHGRIALQPKVLRWARERASLTRGALANKIKVETSRVAEWEETGDISVEEVDLLAKRTYTPRGFLYLSEPPEDRLPIRDFRTRNEYLERRPSPNLLETVYLMQRRQAWMREDLIENGAEPLSFVGSYSLNHSHVEVAGAMRETLRIAHGWAERERTWSHALRTLRDRLETAGVLIVANGIVNNSTNRRLDPDEFQGFALVDDYAPLIFVNNADFVAAKIFTMSHELAHVYIGEAGVSRFEELQPAQDDTELFCNRVAAEFLVPEGELRAFWRRAEMPLEERYQSIAHHFKVSSLVAARRALDSELITQDTFFDFYKNQKRQQEESRKPTSKGGSFWPNQRWRIGRRFAGAVVRATKEGRLTYREAWSLTGLKSRLFDQLAGKMDIPL